MFNHCHRSTVLEAMLRFLCNYSLSPLCSVLLLLVYVFMIIAFQLSWFLQVLEDLEIDSAIFQHLGKSGK